MDDEAFGDLITEAFELAEMAKHPGWRYVQQRLAKVLEGNREKIMSGRCEDLAEYKLVAGELKGIQRVLSVPADVDRKVKAEQERRSG